MVGLNNFSIVLDSPTGAFYAGTMITGKVLISLAKPKTVRALNLKIEGVAKVSWSESESVRNAEGETKTETVHYDGEEEYFSNKFKLLGSGSGDTEIPIGDHVYPFSSSLPPLLPSSFEGEHGSIRYSVKAVMDRPWKMDHDTKLSFTVVAPLDLNYNAMAKEPVKEEREKTFCCFCCESGPLQLVVSIPHKGYVSGQSIPLTIEVDNASNVEVDAVTCELTKVLKYTAHRPRHEEKSEKIKLSKLSLEGVSVRGSKSWSQQLTIPAMPFVNLEACSIIKTTYCLQVEAEVSGLHSDLEVSVPIIIGSVPIGQVPESNLSPAMDMAQGNYTVNSVSPGYGGPPGFGGPPGPGFGGPQASGYGPPAQPGYAAPGYGGPPGSGYASPAQPGYTAPGAPPGFGAAYPSENPYPPSGAGNPYPPSGAGNPYPPSGAGNPYPPSGAGNPYPPSGAGNPYPPSGAGNPYPPPYRSPLDATAPSAPPPTVPPLGFNIDEFNHSSEKTPLYPNPSS